jgi:hypothetical protein
MKTRSGPASRFPITEHTKIRVLDGGVPMDSQSARNRLTAIGSRYVSPSPDVSTQLLESVSKILDRMDKQMEQLHKLQSFDDEFEVEDIEDGSSECECEYDSEKTEEDDTSSPEFIKFKTYTISPMEAKYLLNLVVK